MFFHCAFQLISIKLQLGYFDLVKKNYKKIQLTNNTTQKHDNMKKRDFWKYKKKSYVFKSYLFLQINSSNIFDAPQKKAIHDEGQWISYFGQLSF